MKVLAVQNVWCEGLGTFAKLLRADGFETDLINASKDHLPNSPGPYAGIIILGGPMAAYDELSYMRREQELIRSSIKKGVPLLGICLGSQLIAQSCGGRVFKGEKKEIGWGRVQVTPDGLADIFRGTQPKKSIEVFQWHGDTYQLPSHATVLAQNELYPQAFRIGSAVGLQFHVEVDNEMIKLWSKEYSGELDSERLSPSDLTPAPRDLATLKSNCMAIYRNFSAKMKAPGKRRAGARR